MAIFSTPYKSGGELSPRSLLLWRIAQAGVWLVGAVIFFCLVFFPDLGVLLFWNILIPIAPALIVLAVGLWRNVCPLATTALLPRHLGLSKRKIMSVPLQGKLGLISIIGLYIIVPLRHPLFNVSGHATAWLLTGSATVAVAMGLFYEWKSAWCSSLCPVHPVEKMYGRNVIGSLPNAHCTHCMKCVVPCPDSTPNVDPLASQKTGYHRLGSMLITGGLPGFIWGWFHQPDNTPLHTLSDLVVIYMIPLTGLLCSLAAYWLLTYLFNAKQEKTITALFAAAAVSCYYWYRIPSLFGFGHFPADGLLVDLSNSFTPNVVWATIILTTIFFFYWLVIRKPNKASWVIRPEYG